MSKMGGMCIRVLPLMLCAAMMSAASFEVLEAQGKTGPRGLDACGLVTKAELEEGLKKKVQPRQVPPATPASLGVSHCMWATPNGRQTLSVTTYTPEALARTHTKTLAVYYDSLKTSNANNAGRPAQVLPGIARHASYFAGQGAASTVLVHRNDCIVVISLTGMSKEEATAVARAAGN
jgi:hypothetical protein